MNRVLYSFLFYLAVPAIVLRLLWRSIKAPAYRQRWHERFGFVPGLSAGAHPNEHQSIWIHSVSVGETLAAVPLIKSLQQQYPLRSIIVTTMTPTGSERVKQIFSDSVYHVYAPYDLPGSVRRFIKRTRPALLIILETEIWPNMIHHSQDLGVKVLLANARLSEKSAKGYQRFSAMSEQVLSEIDCIAAQTETDANRFKLLCADSKIEIIGSLKFNVDVSLTFPEDSTVFDSVNQSGRAVLIAASTRIGEEEKVLEAFSQCLKQFPTLLLVLVPRHPERFGAVANQCRAKGFTVIKRSSNKFVEQHCQVLLGDSMGEMLLYYSLADIAFVGGSLVDTGCQNVLEPAAMGIAVLTGPSQFNFAQICAQLEQAGALITVQNEDELAVNVMRLLAQEQLTSRMGKAGKRLVEQNKEALPRLMRVVARLLG